MYYWALHKDKHLHDNNEDLEGIHFPGLMGEGCRKFSSTPPRARGEGQVVGEKKEEEGRYSPKVVVNQILPQTGRE